MCVGKFARSKLQKQIEGCGRSIVSGTEAFRGKMALCKPPRCKLRNFDSPSGEGDPQTGEKGSLGKREDHPITN